MIKPDYDDPDLAVVLKVADNTDDRNTAIAFLKHLEKELGKQTCSPGWSWFTL